MNAGFLSVSKRCALHAHDGRLKRAGGTTAIGTSSARNSGTTNPGTRIRMLTGAVAGLKWRSRTLWIAGRSSRRRRYIVGDTTSSSLPPTSAQVALTLSMHFSICVATSPAPITLRSASHATRPVAWTTMPSPWITPCEKARPSGPQMPLGLNPSTTALASHRTLVWGAEMEKTVAALAERRMAFADHRAGAREPRHRRLAPRRVGKMDRAGLLAGRHLVAQFDQRFEDSGFGRIDEVVAAAHFKQSGWRRRRLRRLGERADQPQHAANSRLGSRERRGRHRAAAAKLGSQVIDVLARSRGRQRAVFAHRRVDHVTDRRAKDFQQRDRVRHAPRV